MTEIAPQLYSEPEPGKQLTPWVTWLLIGSTVAVFLLQLLVAHVEGDDLVGNALAFSPGAFWEGRYWTLLTYAWAHATVLFGDPDLFWLHLVSNMIPLYCFGPALEDLLGHGRFLGLYVGGALASSLLWFSFNADGGESAAIIGASGAIFALIAAAGTLAPRERLLVLLFYVVPLRMNLRTLALVACGLELVQLIFGWLPEIAHSVHLGGAAFGFLYAMGIRLLSRRAASPG